MSKFINTQCCCLVTYCPVGNMDFGMQKIRFTLPRLD